MTDNAVCLTPTGDLDILRVLVDTRDKVVQKSRIAFGNRLEAVRSGRDTTDERGLELISTYHTTMAKMEKELDSDIESIAATVPIIRDMVQVKGIGLVLAAKVVSLVDIAVPSNVSSLWRYCGFAVIDGTAERSVKGEKNHYNARLKTVCWNVALSFLRTSSPYRAVYDSSRAYYDANRPDWTKDRRHKAALRRMVKLWLSHLWVHWRTMEGLTITAPYALEKLGHQHASDASAFGWPPPIPLRSPQ